MATKKAAAKAAAKKAAARARKDDFDDEDDELEGELLPAGEAELATVLAELGGLSDATITVNKEGPKGEERLGKYMAAEFDLDRIRELYGGGVYWLYCHAGGELQTRRRVVMARTIDELRADAGARPMPGVAGGNLEATIAAAFDRMAAQQREVLTMITQRPAGPTAVELIELVSKVSNLGGKRDAGGGINEFLQMFKLAREMSGEGGGSVLGEFAAEFVRSMREQPSSPATAATAGQLAPPVNGGGDQMMMLVKRALAQQLPVLIKGAQKGTDPASYADLMLDQVPEMYLPALLEFLKRPDWFTVLAQADGRAVPYQGWLESLRNEIIQATAQPEPPPS